MQAMQQVWTLLAEDDLGYRHLLIGYSEPAWNGESRRWARDQEGHWYSFNGTNSELVESSSGKWFKVVREKNHQAEAVSSD